MTFPPLLVLGLASLAFGLSLGTLVGALADAGPAPGPWSRKVFHVAVFSGAVPAHLLQGFWGVVTYGGVLALLILIAVWRSSGSGLYHALARRPGTDLGRGDILVPLMSTAVGGLISTLLVGDLAVVGYLVCGWGDAAGEPVGRRWGKRRYQPPWYKNGHRARSLEGSGAVFLVGALGAWMALTILGIPLPESLWAGILCGVTGAVAEGASGPGTDNFWVQVVSSLSAWWVLG